jgi:chromosome segregation ATPase
MDALHIEEGPYHDQIFNCLVDQIGLEKRLLIDDEKQAEEYIHNVNGRMAYNNPDIKDMITAKGTVLQWKNSVRLSAPTKYKNPRGNLKADANMHENLDGLKNGIIDKKEERKNIIQRLAEVKQHDRGQRDTLAAVSTDIKDLTMRRREAARKMKNSENELSELQENEAVDTSKYEDEISELKASIVDLDRNIGDYENQLTDNKAKLKELKKSRDEANQKKGDLDEKTAKLHEKLDKVLRSAESNEKQLAKLRQNCSKAEKNLVDTTEKKDGAINALNKCTETAVSESEKYIKDWDENPIPIGKKDNRKKVEAEAQAHKEDLERGKREVGLSGLTLSVAMDRYTKAKELFSDQKQNYILLKKNLADFKDDVSIRTNAFKQHRKRNGEIVDTYFGRYLSDKGFEGNCLITHEVPQKKIKASLKLETKIGGARNAEVTTDVRQLSGGERSFTTLCLLLALGHVIDTPFRVMDEYDVFLDELARKVTLIQLQDYASNAKQRGKQFIIITPNNLKDINTSKTCKIHRLKDPERRAATGLQQQVMPMDS